MNFTAEEVRKAAAWLHQWERKSGARNARAMLTAYADAIDAHIAGMSEPAGYLRQVDGITQWSEGRECPSNRSGGYATPWVALYTAAPIDLAAVREVIAELRDYGDYADRIKLGEATDKLEAAIKGGV